MFHLQANSLILAAPVSRAGLQSGQPAAPAGTGAADQELVVDELAAAAGEDCWATDQARQVLLIIAGRGTSAQAAVWPDAAAGLGAACPTG